MYSAKIVAWNSAKQSYDWHLTYTARGSSIAKYLTIHWLKKGKSFKLNSAWKMYYDISVGFDTPVRAPCIKPCVQLDIMTSNYMFCYHDKEHVVMPSCCFVCLFVCFLDVSSNTIFLFCFHSYVIHHIYAKDSILTIPEFLQIATACSHYLHFNINYSEIPTFNTIRFRCS